MFGKRREGEGGRGGGGKGEGGRLDASTIMLLEKWFDRLSWGYSDNS